MEKFEVIRDIKNIATRSLLALTLLSAPIMTTSCGGVFEGRKISKELEQLKTEKDSLAEAYKNNPEVIFSPEFFEKIQKIFVYEEYLGYCEREDTSINKAYFSEVVYSNFLDKISLDINLEVENERDALGVVFQLKESFHNMLGRTDTYEANHPNFVDPAFEKAFQCRSGTENMLYLMSKVSQLSEKVRLVYIHTYGHVIPGFIFYDKLYGIESTVLGNGMVEFGAIDKVEVPIRVSDYKMQVASQVIPGISDKEISILDTVKDDRKEMYSMSKDEEKAWSGVHLSKNSFGKVNVPPGRKELRQSSAISARIYREDFINNYYGQSSGRQEGLRPEVSSKVERYNTEYQIELNTFWNQHVDICNNPPESKEEFKAKVLQLLDELKVFLDGNKAQESYEEMKSELNKIGQAPSLKSPNQTHDVILHNMTVTLNNKYNQ